jgi:DNA-binding NarL/FixJ family response regulator
MTGGEAVVLTDDELFVLQHLARGWTYRMISRSLGMSMTTVQGKVACVRRLLQASNTASAIAEAYRHRLLFDLMPKPGVVIPDPVLQDILGDMAAGLRDQEIAAKYGMKWPTVRHHIQQLYDLLDARNRCQTVAQGYRYGCLDIPCSQPKPALGVLLSCRERQVVAGLARGQQRFRVASQLGMRESTVKTLLAQTCRRLDQRNSAGLVGAAYRLSLLPGFKPEPRPAIVLPILQQEVLDGLAYGLEAAEIACKLGVSCGSVKAELKKLYKALGARNRVHAVALGYQHGHLAVAGELQSAS